MKWKNLKSMLSILLPGQEETWLLRACLLAPPASEEAWKAWTHRIQDPAGYFLKDRLGIKGLMPLLLDNLKRNPVERDPAIRGSLEAAMIREEIHSEAMRRLCRETFDLLNTAGVQFMVLRGPALAETVYEQAFLRHYDDMHLLLDPENQAATIHALEGAGLPRRNGSWEGMGSNTVVFEHNAGFRIHLQRETLAVPYFEPPGQGLRKRALSRRVAGADVRVPSPADHLLHVCAHAITSRSRDSRAGCAMRFFSREACRIQTGSSSLKRPWKAAWPCPVPSCSGT